MTLPVLPDEPQVMEKPFPAPCDLPAAKSFDTLTAPSLTRSRETAPDEDIAIKWHQPPVSVRYNDIGTTFSYETWADHVIDPENTNSARSVFTHQMSIERPDGCASVKSRLQATCDADRYWLDGWIEVSWSGETIFQRHFSRSVARRLS